MKEVSPYDAFAEVYDHAMSHVPYSSWALYLYRTAREILGKIPGNVVDLSCGTGKILYYLQKRIPEVQGRDGSSSMLMIAKKRLPGVTLMPGRLEGPFADQSETHEWLIACHDSINYLTKAEDLQSHFHEVSRTLKKGGLYSTDTVTLFNIKNYFHLKTDYIKKDATTIRWSNEYNENSKILISDLCFSKNGMERYFERHFQRYYDESLIEHLAGNAGLKLVLKEGDYEARKPGKEDILRNWHFIK